MPYISDIEGLILPCKCLILQYLIFVQSSVSSSKFLSPIKYFERMYFYWFLVGFFSLWTIYRELSFLIFSPETAKMQLQCPRPHSFREVHVCMVLLCLLMTCEIFLKYILLDFIIFSHLVLYLKSHLWGPPLWSISILIYVGLLKLFLWLLATYWQWNLLKKANM